jgi:hypothetical protein
MNGGIPMDTEAFRKRINTRVASFAKKDPRVFPDIQIHILDNERPSGEVFLVRKGKRSPPIDNFNTSAQLGMIIETVCREWRKTPPPKSKSRESW